jgi:hypothetical protein
LKRKTRIEITTFTEQAIIIRPGIPVLLAWCESCSAQVSVITTEQAAALAHVSGRTVFQWIACGKLHCAENPLGGLLICLNSLSIND